MDEIKPKEVKTPWVVQGGDLEWVRKRPGMYFGGSDVRGLVNCAFEIFGNAFDQYLQGFARRIDVSVSGQTATVEDDGRGVNSALLVTAFTTLHTSATLDGHHPHVHVGLTPYGIGVGAVCALSSSTVVRTVFEGIGTEARFAMGKLLSQSAFDPEGTRGTRVTWTADETIFRTATFDIEPERSPFSADSSLRAQLKSIAMLAPGLRLTLNGRPVARGENLVTATRALRRSAIEKTKLHFWGTHDDVDVEVSLLLGERKRRHVVAFTNYQRMKDPAAQGRGLLEGLRESAPSPSALNFATKHVAAHVHVGMTNPRFQGPVKAALMSEEAAQAVCAVVANALRERPWWWDRVLELL